MGRHLLNQTHVNVVPACNGHYLIMLPQELKSLELGIEDKPTTAGILSGHLLSFQVLSGEVLPLLDT